MEAEIRNVANSYFEKPKRVRTVSHLPLKALYTPKDVENFNYELDIADAGKFPYTRGIYPTMYRGRLWTRRVGWGYGTPKDTNQQLTIPNWSSYNVSPSHSSARAYSIHTYIIRC